MAFAAPSVSIAQAMPDNLLGLGLGEIQSASYLNEPFKAIIPILFSNIEESSQLSVKLAPDSVFSQIGAEKLPIHNNLKFQIKKKNNKPVIFVSSSQSIPIPFLNFVLEIVGADGKKVYQDYTVLLDPVNYQGSGIISSMSADELESVKIIEALTEIESQPATTSISQSKLDFKINEWNDNELSKEAALEVEKIKANLLFAAHASPRLSKGKTTKYVVKGGDSLSKITQELSTGEISLQKMMQGIHANNPHAFVKNNINRLKKGAILSIPSLKELNEGIINQQAISASSPDKDDVSSSDKKLTQNSYKVKRGDTLSKIVREVGYEGTSFTKMLNTIHSNNPHAFSRNNINKLKTGSILLLPLFEKSLVSDNKIATKQTAQDSTASVIKTVQKSTQPKNDVAKNTDEFAPKTYTVKKGDTLAQVIKEIGYEGVSFTKMMKAIYAVNPQAFSQSNITILKESAVIQLPPLSEIEEIVGATTKTAKVPERKVLDKKDLNKKLVKINKNNKKIQNIEKSIRDLRIELVKSQENLSSSEAAINNVSSTDTPNKTNGYTVQKGDTLAQIVKKIGHKNVSFTKMMKAIYTSNKEAFLKNNITRLKEGSVIYIPSLSQMSGTASVVVSSRQLIIEHEKNQRATNNLKKKLRELRRDLAKSKSNSFELELTEIEKASLDEEPVVTQTSETKSTKEAIIDNELLAKDKIKNKGVVANLPLLGIDQKGYTVPETAGAMIKTAVVSHAKSMSNKDMVYSIMALFLGLLLIRYRKQLYGYVAISYEHPKYYPAKKSSTKSAEEREKEIIKYHETLVELDKDKDLEINEDFLDKCETLAEDFYNSKDYDEVACDKISDDALEIIKKEIENDALEDINLDKTQDTVDANARFEKIGLDLFGDLDDLEEDSAKQEPSMDADVSNFFEVNLDPPIQDNAIDKSPKTDWEKLLDTADKELSEGILDTKKQNDEVSDNTSQEAAYETKPEIPANMSNGSFENIEMPTLNIIKPLSTNEEDAVEDDLLSFTKKSQTNKFEEAIMDENSFYDEYCRNQLLLAENGEESLAAPA